MEQFAEQFKKAIEEKLEYSRQNDNGLRYEIKRAVYLDLIDALKTIADK